MPLLPQQIAPVDQKQLELTERYLLHHQEPIMGYFLALRAEIDTRLAPLFPFAAGKAYPYGRCEEITRELYEHLAQRLRNPAHPIEEAIYNFITQGGIVRTIWGVLRDQYFQNAIQFGSLYIDVSNDTVFVTKPKVEILPIEQSGLVSVRDLAHFRKAAELYWGGAIYANHLIPSLAPLLPMVSYSPGRLKPGLQSACNYMIALMCRDKFQQAEQWLSDGPPPPSDIAESILATTPADLKAWTHHGKEEAIVACQRARVANCQEDTTWRDARVLDYVRSVRS
ncbi:MAG: hypothetical protein V4525_11805 [Pseudomonadota bacterium]